MKLFLMIAMVLCSGSAFADERVECSSINYQPNQCRIRGWGANVTIAQVLSRATSRGGSCSSNEWSFDENYIYVNSGCRAIFNVDTRGGHGGGRDRIIECSSLNYAYAECDAGRRGARSVTLVEQLSRRNRRGGDCTYGSTYGITGNGNIWVNNGCRGRFQVR